MNPPDPRLLNTKLQIIRNLIPHIQTIPIRLIAHLQKPIHTLLIYTHTAPKLTQSFIRVISRLMHNIDIEIFLLRFHQFGAVIPEFIGVQTQDCDGGLVHERAGRVPWLDLLPENELYAVCVGFTAAGEGGESAGEGQELFCGEGTDVVEVWNIRLTGVKGLVAGAI